MTKESEAAQRIRGWLKGDHGGEALVTRYDLETLLDFVEQVEAAPAQMPQQEPGTPTRAPETGALESLAEELEGDKWHVSAVTMQRAADMLRLLAAQKNTRRLTGLWRFGRDVLPVVKVDFNGWLFQLDGLIDEKTSLPQPKTETACRAADPAVAPVQEAQALAQDAERLSDELDRKQHQFVRETLRTSELAALLRRFAEEHRSTHGPGPWAKGCQLCALVGEADTLLAKPINVPAFDRKYTEEEDDAYMHGWFDGKDEVDRLAAAAAQGKERT